MKYGIIVRWKLFNWNIWETVEGVCGFCFGQRLIHECEIVNKFIKITNENLIIDEAASFFNKIKNTSQIQ
jgi:hypothetical protein